MQPTCAANSGDMTVCPPAVSKEKQSLPTVGLHPHGDTLPVRLEPQGGDGRIRGRIGPRRLRNGCSAGHRQESGHQQDGDTHGGEAPFAGAGAGAGAGASGSTTFAAQTAGIGHVNLPAAQAHRRCGAPTQRLGLSIVPVQSFEPQRQAQIFFSRGVWRSARVMKVVVGRLRPA